MTQKSLPHTRNGVPTIGAILRSQTVKEILGMPPKWLRVEAAVRLSSLSRNQIFQEMKRGRLKNRLYTQPGNSKGVRLIEYDSLMALIEGMPE